ncbi:MAG: hypothetical protein WC965_11845 [Thiohalomonadaceae bacterium]
MPSSIINAEILEIIRPKLNTFCMAIRTNAIKIVDAEKMVVTGMLRASIQTKLILESDDQHIEVYVNDPGNNKLKYAKYLHEGIKPHMPPLDPIRQWVAKKGLHKTALAAAWNKTKQSNQGMKRHAQKKKGELESRLIDSIAWAVAINMKKKGKKPVPFLSLAIKMTLEGQE